MTTALVAGSLLTILFAIVMILVASKVLRNNRARSAARIAALQALVAGPSGSTGVHVPSAPETFAELADENDWDLALGGQSEVPPSPGLRGTSRTFTFAKADELADRSAGQAVPSHLFEEAVEHTPNRRFAWTAGVGLAMASVAGVIYVVSSGAIGQVFATNGAATPSAAAAVTQATPIELLSLRYSIEAPDTFVVTGLVQNPAASASLRGVTAVVYLFDTEGRYFASSRATLDSAVLSPGGEAPFTVKVPKSVSSLADLSRYRVSFQLEDGAAVRHVDRRGTLPEGTTGDTVEARTPSPQSPIVTARKSR